MRGVSRELSASFTSKLLFSGRLVSVYTSNSCRWLEYFSVTSVYMCTFCLLFLEICVILYINTDLLRSMLFCSQVGICINNIV